MSMPEMYRRLLFELARLRSDVQQLRQLVERQSCVRSKPYSKDMIPELTRGPVNSTEQYYSLLERCTSSESQSALVRC